MRWSILWLDENLAGLLVIEPRCLGEEECTDEVIKKSTDFRLWPLADLGACDGNVRFQGQSRPGRGWAGCRLLTLSRRETHRSQGPLSGVERTQERGGADFRFDPERKLVSYRILYQFRSAQNTTVVIREDPPSRVRQQTWRGLPLGVRLTRFPVSKSATIIAANFSRPSADHLDSPSSREWPPQTPSRPSD
jgi:hypothetical protein